MSGMFVIAGVTALLRHLLNDGLASRNVSNVVGTNVSISVLTPDRMAIEQDAGSSRLNLFLYAVMPNLEWRNENPPVRDSSGRRSSAPLALDLYYMVSAFSDEDLHAEVLLGHAMQLFQEHPMLTREFMRSALSPSLLETNSPSPVLRALVNSGLAEQLEDIRLAPHHLEEQELCRLWLGTQSPMRLSLLYRASVVLIQ